LRKPFAIIVIGLPQTSAATPEIKPENAVDLAGNRINFLTHSGQSELSICTVQWLVHY